MSLMSLWKGKGPNGFGYASTAEEVTSGLDLRGQTILLTGCNSGIGKETLRVLTGRGAHVIATARSVEKAQAACVEVGGATTPVACELSEPASVKACAEEVIALGQPLDAIICNAGVMALRELGQQHGYEAQLFTNHIGHFILVTSLLDQLADQGRVVVVASEAHKGAPPEGIQFDNLTGAREYGTWQAYGQSKLANILFTRELARRLEDTGRTANCLHPGVINTGIVRNTNPIARALVTLVAPLIFKSIGQGAATQCYLAVHPDVRGVTGKYFDDCNEAKPTRRGRDDELAAKLWDVSERIVAEVV